MCRRFDRFMNYLDARVKTVFFILLLVFLASPFCVLAQEKQETIGMVEGKDTLIYKLLDEIWVYPGKKTRSPKQEKDFWKYVYKVKKIYPYAKTAAELLKQYEPEYLKLTRQKDKRKFMNKIEHELMARYKEELKRLTISEGRLLIKLVDRETSRTIYSLVRDFRGEIAVFFWQSLARLFGNNLKDSYDPYGEDRLTEEIVKMIEMGFI